MLNYQAQIQKSVIVKADEVTGVITRKAVYYPKLVDLNDMDVFQLIDVILANGSTAFTRGEWMGVAMDLGSSIASQLINGYRVHIDGLGTFEPVLNTTQSNIEDPSKINSSKFTCGAKFTPDARFLIGLTDVEWKRKSGTASGSSSSAAYKFTFVKQTNASGLQFKIDNEDILSNVDKARISATVNGTAVSNNDISISGSNLYLNNQISQGDTLTDATVVITMPSVSWTEGEETYSYTAQTLTIKNVSQTGPTGGGLAFGDV